LLKEVNTSVLDWPTDLA